MARIVRSTTLLGLFLVFGFPPAASAKATGARIVYDSTMSQEGRTVKMQTTYLIQGGAVRFETEMPAEMTGGAPGKMTMIAKPDAKKYLMLMDAQKMYMELPDPNQGPAGKTAEPVVPFKPLGTKKTVAGYSCEVFARTLEGRKEEACTSKELNDVFRELEKSMPKGKGEVSSLPEGLNGFPMEFSVKGIAKDSDMPDIQMRVKEFKREVVAASAFEVPKGYTKQAMPSFEVTTDPPAAPAKKKK